MTNEVVKYINKQKPPKKEICLALRSIILKTCPGIKEEMKWGALVYGEGKFYIGVVKYGVNLGFAIKSLSQEEINLFEGQGTTMRHVKITKLEEIDEPKLAKLIKMVHKKAICSSCK